MEKNVKIMLVLSLVGILGIFFLSYALEPKSQTLISDIASESIGKNLMVVGEITSIREYNNNTFAVLKIRDESGEIGVVASSRKGINLVVNHTINYTIIGKVQEYNQTLQINAEIIQPFSL